VTPSLEAIIFSSPTVSLNINRLSKPLEQPEHMFKSSMLNCSVAFKYPNFDTSTPSSATIPGLETTPDSSDAVKTAIFVPKDSEDLTLGGFGIFMDDDRLNELMQRYCGFDMESKEGTSDMSILKVLSNIPSLDPFLVKEALGLEKIEINPAYTTISDAERAAIRGVIATKVEPIIDKAIGNKSLKEVEGKADEFLDAIWNPSAPSANLFIRAFGIKQTEAPQVFSAWKGVAFFYNEFTKSTSGIAKVLGWLGSEQSLPKEYRILAKGEKEQISMFRDSVHNKIRKVVENVNGIFKIYHHSHSRFIENDDPTEFRTFLQSATEYYWKLGACNGVLAQISITWDRYCGQTNGRPLEYAVLERLFKVCDNILQSRGEGSSLSGSV